MAEDLKDFDEELHQLCSEIQKGIDEYPRSKEKADRYNFLSSRIQRAKDVHKSYKVEIRDLSRVEAEPWNRKAKDHEIQINKLVENFKLAQDKAELMKGRKEVKDKPVDELTKEEILDKAAKIQDADKKRLDNVLQVVQITQDVASATADELKKQTEALERIETVFNFFRNQNLFVK
jgi:hypothetical protein